MRSVNDPAKVYAYPVFHLTEVTPLYKQKLTYVVETQLPSRWEQIVTTLFKAFLVDSISRTSLSQITVLNFREPIWTNIYIFDVRI